MDTWGISGPAFLGIFAALVALTTAAVVVANWRDGRQQPPPPDLDEYQVAMLNGGDGLVASIALLNLDRAGAVELGDRLLRDLADSNELDLEDFTSRDLDSLGVGMDITVLRKPAPGTHPVEVGVHWAVRESDNRTPFGVIRKAAGSREFGDLRAGLIAAGLFRGPAELARQRRRWRFFVPVLALGLLRLAYGLQRDRPVGYLVMLLIAGGILAVTVSRWQSQQTSRAKAVLDRIRRSQPNPYEAIESVDVAGSHRDAALGMALALTGTAPLWAASPVLAAAITGPPDAPAAKWWHGGGGDTAGWGHGCGLGAGDGGGGGGGCGGGGGGCGG